MHVLAYYAIAIAAFEFYHVEKRRSVNDMLSTLLSDLCDLGGAMHLASITRRWLRRGDLFLSTLVMLVESHSISFKVQNESSMLAIPAFALFLPMDS